VTLDPDEIDALKLESKKTIDLTRFVDGAHIDPRYFERPYCLGIGDKHGAEGYVVIREALRKTGKVGLGQVTVAGREWLVAVTPVDPDGLGMVMLRYAEELRDPADYFADVPNEKPDKEMVDLAVELIERKAGEFKPEEFENHYHTALRELVDEKMKGHKIRAPHEDATPRGKVVDLMAALRKSISDAPGKSKVKAPEPRRQAAGRRKGCTSEWKCKA
jgi:DNA end-binding protein Ku